MSFNVMMVTKAFMSQVATDNLWRSMMFHHVFFFIQLHHGNGLLNELINISRGR